MNILKLLTVPALASLLFVATGLLPVSAGEKGPHTKPLRGMGTMQAALAGGAVNCFAPDGTLVAQLPAEFDALARYTVMGLTVGTIVVETCDLNPANGTLVVTGVAYQTAANGDEVWAPYSGVFQSDFSFNLEIEVVGGTGRFENACGEADSSGMIDLATGTGRTWLDGWISTGNSGGNNPCD